MLRWLGLRWKKLVIDKKNCWSIAIHSVISLSFFVIKNPGNSFINKIDIVTYHFLPEQQMIFFRSQHFQASIKAFSSTGERGEIPKTAFFNASITGN